MPFKSAIFSLVILFFLNTNSFSQETTWKGFERVNLEVEGRAAYLVKPKIAKAGNPWVWRARFPTWHTEMDSILVSEGFHLVFLNTDNEFGSPTAMKAWDAFYSLLQSKFKLNKKVVLEGVSRGGLFIYNWAKNNPEKVACIYAEAPVCDFKSWPGGFGASKGSPVDWEKLKTAYGFKNDEEAKAYTNIPLIGLEKLAKLKVPIIHMVGLNDQVVPYEENSKLLINKYIELGGPATVIACTRGEQKLQGHHFPIESPRQAADFIQYHVEKSKFINSNNFHNYRANLQSSKKVFESTKKGRVAFLGGSITQNGGWRDSVMLYFQKRFPDTEFEFINAGISSMGSTPAAFRLKRDVIAKGKVDLLLEEAAVNDFTNGRTNSEQKRAMEGIFRQLKKHNPQIDILLMHFVDPNKISDYRNGRVPEVIQNHELVANHYNINSINLALEVQQKIDNNEFTWEDDFKNLHPSPFGQGIYSQSIISFFENQYSKETRIENKFPQNTLDEFNYENGDLIDINNAKLGKGWSIIKNWKPTDGSGTRAGYTNIDMLVSNEANSILSFKFYGRAVGISVAAGSDAGIIDYRIDKGSWKTQNLYTKWSADLHLPWFYTLESELPAGNHNLEIKIAQTKDERSKGNFCRIRTFYINK